jgi:hypothetical protein
MPRRAPDVFDVVGAHALLAGHGVGVLRRAQAQVVRLEGHHARDGEKQGRVIRYQGKAGVMVASFFFPKVYEKLAYLFSGSVLHGENLLVANFVGLLPRIT